MRPVNLLPERHRPRVATGGRSGSAYLLVGVLGLVLAGVAAYALVAKQVNDREAKAARISDQAAATEAEAAQLAPFGQFADLKAARLSAVAGVAASRIDWERLARELSLVLPAQVWLTNVEASMAPSEGSSTTTSTTTTTTSTGPSVSLTGCAPGQPSVATTLVRLRRLNGAVDVKLTESRRVEVDGASSSGAPAAMTGGSGEGGECPGGYSFQATVALSPPPPEAEGVDGVERVPASLGGGS